MPYWLALLLSGALGFGLGVGLVSAAILTRWLRHLDGDVDAPGPEPLPHPDNPSEPRPGD